LTNLKELYLDGNEIKEIEKNALKDLKKLNYLKLPHSFRSSKEIKKSLPERCKIDFYFKSASVGISTV
jgi:Leucine-rich repeat (LRR) protein